MASREFELSHLSADERIELGERPWDSLPVDAVGPDGDQVPELSRRRAALAADGVLGQPWRAVLDEIEMSGV